jgi:hypothetical protein
MVEAHLFVNGVNIGCVRCRNTLRWTKRGATIYDVLYVHPVHNFTFKVSHKRDLGVESLYGKVLTKLARLKQRFFSFPKDIVVHEEGGALVRFKDIPSRYRNPFTEWMSGQTGMKTEDGEMAVFMDDLERWLKMQVCGARPVFD